MIRDALLEEHSKKQAMAVAHEACSSSEKMKELMDCFFGKDLKIAERAAWSVAWAAKVNVDGLLPYVHRLVKKLIDPSTSDPLIRNILAVLEMIRIPVACEGQLMNTCFEIIQDPARAPAIKAYSLTILFHLSIKYPDIRDELACIIEERWDLETAAFRSRGRKILAQIKKS